MSSLNALEVKACLFSRAGNPIDGIVQNDKIVEASEVISRLQTRTERYIRCGRMPLSLSTRGDGDVVPAVFAVVTFPVKVGRMRA